VAAADGRLDNAVSKADDRPMIPRGRGSVPLQTEHELAAVCTALDGGMPAAGSASHVDLDGPVAAFAETARRDIRAGGDPLGEAFCALRAAAARRADGAFYTPLPIVRSMVAWTLDHDPARVVDAGCGSGRFAVELRRAGFTGELVAIDRDPLAVLMTRSHLAAAGFEPLGVIGADFLHLRLPAVEGITAFIGNPPYARHHLLTPDTKAWGKHAGERAGVKTSGLSGLHALFLLGAHLSSRPGDIGCFITSAEWLDARYGAAIRQLMAGPMGCRALDLFEPAASPFEDALSTAVIVGWEQGYEGPVNVRRVAGPSALDRVGVGPAIPRQRLTSSPRWSALHRPATRGPDRRVPLFEIARVHRGVATGANAFFSIPLEVSRQLGLSRHVRPCLHRAAQVIAAEGVVRAADCSHGLLDIGRAPPDSPELQRYLRRGERLGIHRRYLCRHRDPWWRVGGSVAPPIVVTYMARQPPSFALNPDRCQILNVLHGLHFHGEVDPAVQAALVQWLQAHRHDLQGHRTYHGGLQKWEPRDLEAIPVPRLDDLR